MSEQPTKFRKRPVVIEAMKFHGSAESGARIVEWATESGAQAEYHPFLADHFKGDPKVYVAHPDPYMRIVTLEGTMIAQKGDWIIRGVQGEFYPCKPDIFAATYEPVGVADIPEGGAVSDSPTMIEVVASLSETYLDDGVATWLAPTHQSGQFKGQRPIDLCKTAEGRARVFEAAGAMIAT